MDYERQQHAPIYLSLIHIYSQEMVAFITELNANFYSIWFIRENGSDQYYRHNKGLLFDDRQKLILEMCIRDRHHTLPSNRRYHREPASLFYRFQIMRYRNSYALHYCEVQSEEHWEQWHDVQVHACGQKEGP